MNRLHQSIHTQGPSIAYIRVSDASTASSWHASIERCVKRPFFLLIHLCAQSSLSSLYCFLSERRRFCQKDASSAVSISLCPPSCLLPSSRVLAQSQRAAPGVAG